MEAVALTIESRSPAHKGGARKLRASGKVPAVIYCGGSAAHTIAFDPAVFEAIFRKTNNRNTMLRLIADGEERLCLVKEVQRHPLSREIRHVDLYEVREGQSVEVLVDLQMQGDCEGVRAGGRLQQLCRYLTVTCKPETIPAVLPVDVTNLGVGKFVRFSEMVAPEGCTFRPQRDFNVVTVIGKKVVAAAPVAEDAKKKKK
jgi:large subunit ribosomal protein L25